MVMGAGAAPTTEPVRLPMGSYCGVNGVPPPLDQVLYWLSWLAV
ncbi:MAG: hypothetical protein RRC34_16145 [Lentisphaeria bacterium]|nr:hypothetical protein [Lentisphaeria bacterium]